MKIPVFYHDSSLRHETGAHPECAGRVEVVLSHLGSHGDRYDIREPRRATVEEIARVHPADYIGRLREFIGAGGGYLDPDTVVSRGSYDAALFAAGGVISAIDAVLQGAEMAAFSLARPPGHHAREATAMGFCLFNNVAIGARHLLEAKGIEKVAIIDWDVHHGNGTQEVFYEDPNVFYLSLHRYPFYPGTGHPEERGAGEGEGTTRNIAFRAGTAREEYIRAFGDAAKEVASFGPEFVLISAGFDAYRYDPIGGLDLDADDFGTLARVLRTAIPDARGFVSTLEGGYELGGLPRCVEAHLEGLAP
jgi:acetoin utilization deacetylase AcuC-like enzyme